MSIWLNRIRGCFLWGSIASVVSPFMMAQDESEDEAIFELSPFTIDGSEDEGYRATSTLAGTRIKTDLRDLGTSIQEITEEFLDDLGIVDADELLTYTTSTETAGLGGNFSGALPGNSGVDTSAARAEPQLATRVRGLGRADLTRNYFKTVIPFDSYNTSRIGINRGSNSVLFGLGSPAGIINNTPREAIFKNSAKLINRLDDEGSVRFSLDANRVLVEDKLALRIALLSDQREFKQRPAFSDSERIYASLKWRPLKNSTFKVNFEDGNIESRRADVLGPRENITSWFLAGRPILDQRLTTGILFDAPVSEGGLGGHSGIFVDTDGDGVEEEIGPDQIRGTLFDTYVQRAGGGFYNEGNWTFNSRRNEIRAPRISYGGGSTSNLTFSTPRIFNVAATVTNGFDSVTRDGIGFQGTINPQGTVPGDALTSLGDGTDEQRRFYGLFNVDRFFDNYSRQGFVDTSIYDFTNNLIGGSTSFQDTDFDAVNLAFEQTFMDGKFGFEVAFDKQTYFNQAYAPTVSNQAEIYVDINTLLPDGRLNPNLGRPYINANGRVRNVEREFETRRFTAFARHDFAEQFDGGLGRWLGNHTITGLVDRNDQRELSYGSRLSWADPDFLRVQGASADATAFNAAVANIVYVGPSLLDAQSLDDVVIDGVSRNLELFNPGESYTIRYWDPGVNPNDPTRNISDRDRGYDAVGAIRSGGRFIQRDIQSRVAITSAGLAKVETDSEAAVLQSRFFGNSLVGTVGFRKDTVLNENFINPGTDDLNTIVLSTIEDEAERVVTGGTSENWSYQGVYHIPDRFLPDGVRLSAHYATSSNISLEARVNWNGERLPFPSGDTEEVGFSLELSKKFHVRVNRYETSISDANAGLFITSPVWNNILQSSDFLLKGLGTHEQQVYEDFNRAHADLLLSGLTDGQRDLYNVRVQPDEVFRDAPSISLRDTEDLVSKGEEIELTFNPTRNWRIHANIARQERVSSNVLPFHENEYLPRLQELLNRPIPGFEDVRLATADGRQIVSGDLPRGAINEGTYYLGPSDPNDPTSTRIFGRGTEIGDLATTFSGSTQRQYDAQLVRFRSEQALEGSPSPEQREWRLNVVTNYRFREGRLKGLSLGGAYRWQDEVSIGFPIVLNELGEEVGDVLNPVFAPSQDNVDLVVGYDMPRFKDFAKWRIQLNVRNVFADEDDVIPVSVQGGLPGVFGRVRTAPQRQFLLTNTFTF